MFFGVLCTYAVVWGVFNLIDGAVTWAFSPPAIAGSTSYVAEKLDEFRVEDLQQKSGEGIFASSPVRLVDAYPDLLSFPEELQTPELFRIYNLTDVEREDLSKMFQPLITFEMWSSKVPAPIRDLQRREFLVPIISYLERIPAIRQEGEKNA